MRIPRSPAWIALIAVFSSLCLARALAAPGVADASPVIGNGYIDVRGKSGPIELDARWAFWPGQFIYPLVAADRAVRFERFPDAWTRYGPQSLGRHGYASYALELRGLDPTVHYALRVPAYRDAVRYFVDGLEVHAQGIPATSREGEVPDWSCALVRLPSGKESCTVVLHLSCFNDFYPAGSVPIALGSVDILEAERSRDRLLIMIPFGALLALGGYFLSLSILRKADRPAFALALVCGIFALRALCYDEFLIRDFFPRLSGIAVFRLGFLTFATLPGAVLLFLASLFPGVAKRWVLAVSVALSLLYCLLILALPAHAVIALLLPFQGFCALLGAYIAFALTVASIRKEEGARTVLAGFFAFSAFALHDILVSNRVLGGRFLAQVGVLALVAAMAIIVIRRMSLAFANAESASRELARVNAAFSRFVPGEFLRALGKPSIGEVCLGDTTRRQMCVSFINLSLDLPPGDSGSLLARLELYNDILREVNPCLRRFGGFVERHLDDGVMALFPDDPRSSVLCALELAGLVAAYNGNRFREGLPTVRFAVGIHRDALMIGTVGESGRMGSAVISGAVGIAKRLKDYALERNLAIVITDDVAAPLGGIEPCACTLVPQGYLRLQAKGPRISAFEVRP